MGTNTVRIGIGVAVVLGVLLAWSWSEQRENAKQIATLEKTLSEVRALPEETEDLRARVFAQQKRIRDLESRSESSTSARSHDGGEGSPEVKEVVSTLTQEPEALDIITAEVAARFAESPALGAGDVPPEKLQDMVTEASRLQREERHEQRNARRMDRARERAKKYATALNLGPREQGQLATILQDGTSKRGDLRRQMRDGEIDHDTYDRERKKLHNDTAAEVETLLGAEKAKELLELREKERNEERERRRNDLF